MGNQSITDKLKQYKFPILVFLLGVCLLLLPAETESDEKATDDQRMQTVLSRTAGVGEANVISSEEGVVICCKGAESAQVRMDIIRAVRSYTGFGSDKITILKMK